MTSKKSLHRAAFVSAMAATCAALAACSGDDDINATHGHTSTGTPDATVDAPVTPDTDSGPVGQPLCGKYGGYAFVQKLADDVDTKMAADCRVSAHFTALDAQTAQHMKECNEKLFGTYFQCPGVVYDKDSKGNDCRDMRTSHQRLNLRIDDFRAALDDVIATMKTSGMSDDDVTAIAPTFVGLQDQISRTQSKGNSQCTCPNMEYDGGYCGFDAGTVDASDSGKETGAADTSTPVDSSSGVDAADAAQPVDAGGGG